MITGLFTRTDVVSRLCVPKMVFTLWLPPDGFPPAVLNCAVVLSNLSEVEVPGPILLRTTDQLRNIQDISETLLDPTNPMSTNYSGAYRLGQGRVLEVYDGVPNVRVGSMRLSKVRRDGDLWLHEIDIGQLAPRETVAFRFIAHVLGGKSLDEPGDPWELALRFFDTSGAPAAERERLGDSAIPVLIRYDLETLDGGLDIFLHVAGTWRLAATEPAIDHVTKGLQYDWLGRASRLSWTRYAWWPVHRFYQLSGTRPIDDPANAYFVPPRRLHVWVRLSTMPIADTAGGRGSNALEAAARAGAVETEGQAEPVLSPDLTGELRRAECRARRQPVVAAVVTAVIAVSLVLLWSQNVAPSVATLLSALVFWALAQDWATHPDRSAWVLLFAALPQIMTVWGFFKD